MFTLYDPPLDLFHTETDEYSYWQLRVHGVTVATGKSLGDCMADASEWLLVVQGAMAFLTGQALDKLAAEGANINHDEIPI